METNEHTNRNTTETCFCCGRFIEQRNVTHIGEDMADDIEIAMWLPTDRSMFRCPEQGTRYCSPAIR